MTPVPSSIAKSRWASTCFLLEPLGWVREPLGAIIQIEPRLLEPLVKIDRARMHLLALGLAYARKDITPALAFLLLERSRQEIVETIFGYRPTGLDRILRHLPDKVLSAHTYRKLIDLLNDGATATFLHHSKAITEAKLIGLHNLPSALRRPAVMMMLDRVDGRDGLVDGLRFLAARAGLSFEIVAAEIGALGQPNQVAAKIRALVEALPLPAALPPVEIGPFRRIDCAGQIRALAKAWRNCLAECLCGVNDGSYAIYLSDRWQVVCLVARYGRMGWLLAQAKGPHNSAVEADRLTQIYVAFTDVGVFPAADTETIRNILLCRDWSPHHAPDLRPFHEEMGL